MLISVLLETSNRAITPDTTVGPYVELGLGPSVAWAIGVAIGRNHEYDVSFSYLHHGDEKQVGGAVAFGFGFAVP